MPAIEGVVLRGEQVEVASRIDHNAEWLGTIYLRAHYDVAGRVRAYLGIFALVMLLSMAAALALSTGLQRAMLTPLQAITRVARQIVERRDYSLRVEKTTEDEVGVVVDALNSMLGEVQSTTRALEASNASLTAEVREREAAQQALREADRRKDEFLATLAHELRNPLAPIRNAVAMLDSPQAGESQQRWAREVIARQVRHMALLLDDLLDVSRITRGRLELRRDYIGLKELTAAAVETAKPLIEAKRHTLSVQLPPEPVALNVDPLRMAQALSNILTNAAKYTDPGGEISLRAELSEDELAIAVRDDGIGLSASALDRVFDMFSQVESAKERSQGGLGIGLALVKGLVALHGGAVEAASDGPGCGSTFTIRLTGASLMRDPAPAPLAPLHVDLAQGPRCRILVADDNRDAADTLALVLETAGFPVLVAHSGSDALEIARRERPDVLVLDIGMPQLSGLQVARQIADAAPGYAPLLIAVTGWGQREDREEARLAGFHHHFTKPVDVHELETRLAAFSAELQAARAAGTT